MLRDLLFRLRSLFRRRAVEGELDEELRFHLERQIQKYVQTGLSREEAQRMARLEFGGVERAKEECRDERSANFLETLFQDVRYGLRMLHKNAGLTAVAVFTLALGIGANTAIFSVVNTVLLKPLPYPNSGGLIKVWTRFTGIGLPNDQNWFSAPEFHDLMQQNRSFSDASVVAPGTFNLGLSGNPQSVNGANVSPSLFTILGITPRLGRTFTPEEAQQGRDRVVVLGYGLWQRAFGADPLIVGKEVIVDGRSCQIVGVMPKGFDYPSPSNLWMPQVFVAADYSPNNRGNHGYEVLARLKPAVSLAQARQDMAALSKSIIEQNREYPYARFGFALILHPLLEETVGDVKISLWILMGAVGFVLLLVCANVAGLLLVRSTARQKEITIRVALGAGTRRIMRQLLCESVILSLFGGVLGLLLTPILLQLIVSLGATALPRVVSTQIDAGALLFTFVVAVGTGIVFGLAPALAASGGVHHEILKEGGRAGSEGRASQRLRRLFVVAEAALAVLLLAGSGLLIRSFVKLLAVDPGFRPEGVLTLQVALPAANYGKPEQQRAFFQELVTRAQHLPGVQAAGAISNLPLSGSGNSGTTTVDSRAVTPQDASPETDYRAVTPGYFQAMGISLTSGRYFDDRDADTAPPVAIIDESMASAYWPNEDALGKRIKVGGMESKSPWMTIVGVVRHVRYRTLEARSRVQLYWPEAQRPTGFMFLAVRTSVDPMSLGPAIQRTVLQIDPQQPVDHVLTMEEVMADSLARRRLTLTLLGIFAAGAMLLAALGIYGVTAYMVTQRQQEIGLRMALGASRGNVLVLVIGQGMSLLLAGLAVGLVLSLALMWVLSSLLFSVRPYDPVSLAAAAGALALVALIACGIPAWRAMRVDPMVALRYE
jgi:putative ABC transport system permease protein